MMRTADVIATLGGALVLIERLGDPKGLALPGGKVEHDETPATTAMREFFEETGLTLVITQQFGEYAGAHRDPRYALSMTTVFAGVASGSPRDERGKTRVRIFPLCELREHSKAMYAFDHYQILNEYLMSRK